MESTELVIFNKQEIVDLVTQFGFKIKKENGKDYLLEENGKVKCCEVCERKLEVKKVGSIAHGSRLVFCDNPLCLSSWVVENKID